MTLFDPKLGPQQKMTPKIGRLKKIKIKNYELKLCK